MDNGFDTQMLKLVEQYAACDKRSSDINEERKVIRDNAEKLGIPSLHFQHAVMRAKKMTKTERMSYDENVEHIISIVEGKQAELWPEDTKRSEKREAARKAEEDAKGVDPDTNPRSDPKRGGAGKKKAAQIDLEEAIAEQRQTEQDEGAAALVTEHLH